MVSNCASGAESLRKAMMPPRVQVRLVLVGHWGLDWDVRDPAAMFNPKFNKARRRRYLTGLVSGRL